MLPVENRKQEDNTATETCCRQISAWPNKFTSFAPGSLAWGLGGQGDEQVQGKFHISRLCAC